MRGEKTEGGARSMVRTCMLTPQSERGERWSGRDAGKKTEGGARSMVRTCMLTPLIDGLGRATWSLTMPVTRSRTR